MITQEEKELLLKDLCARLPYGVVVNYNGLAQPLFSVAPTQHFQITLDNALDGKHNGLAYVSLDVDGEEPKPYLRPMSSMTEEEKEELQKITNNKFYAHYNYISNSKPSTDSEWHTPHNNFVTSVECNKTISWLDEKYFDHRTDEEGKTLIEKGLALEAPEGMYNKKSSYETRR